MKYLETAVCEWMGIAIVALSCILIGSVLAAKPPVQNHYFTWEWPQQADASSPRQNASEHPPDSALAVVGAATFDNGSARIRGADKKRLKTLALGLASCGPSNVEVSGVTSSAEYARGSSGSNTELSRRRALAVSGFLKAKGLDAKPSKPSLDEADLVSARHLSDRPQDALDVRVAALNRRVDVTLSDVGKCAIR